MHMRLPSPRQYKRLIYLLTTSGGSSRYTFDGDILSTIGHICSTFGKCLCELVAAVVQTLSSTGVDRKSNFLFAVSDDLISQLHSLRDFG
jgi:hypothetical protein